MTEEEDKPKPQRSYEDLGKIVHQWAQTGTDNDGEPIMKDFAWEMALKESENMTYGRICGMLNWCHAQGPVDPPWETLNWKGFKLWWLSPIAIILIIGGIVGGQDAELMSVFGVLLALVIAFFSLRFSVYKHDRKGKCIMCNKGVDDKYAEKPLRIKNHKGKKIKVSSSTYCHKCATNTDRQSLWRDVEDIVWQKIVDNPTKKRTILRMILHSLPRPFNAIERFTDPRAIGQKTSTKFKRSDRMNPKEKIQVDELEDIQRDIKSIDIRLENYIESVKAGYI